MNVISLHADRLAHRGGLGVRAVAGVRHHRSPRDPFMDYHGIQVRRSDLERAGLVAAGAR